jgi:hypothetical protein
MFWSVQQRSDLVIRSHSYYRHLRCYRRFPAPRMVSMCIRSNSIKTPASDAGKFVEPWLMSRVGRVRGIVCA